MVRIPGSDAEWQQHTHTSGRAFLSNPTTNETRWLWTKWDINGRLFVRNTIDPSNRIWYDDMDLAMRIETGVATDDDIQKFKSTNRLPSSETVVFNAAPIGVRLHNAYPRHPAPRATFPPTRGSFSNSGMSSPRFPPAAISHGSGVSHFRTGSVRNSRFSHTPSQQTVSESSNLSAPVKPFHFVNARYSGSLDSNAQRLGQSSLPSLNSHSDVHSRVPHHNRSFASNVGASLPPRQDGYLAASSACPSMRTKTERNEFDVKDINGKHIEKSNYGNHVLSRNAYSFIPSKRDASDNFSNLSRSPCLSNRDRVYNVTKRSRLTNDRAINESSRSSRSIRDNCLLSRSARRLHAIGLASAPFIMAIHVAKHRLKVSSRGPFSANTSFDEDESYMFEPVVGTNTELEKDYLRLTSAPKPSAVRPPSILRESLAHIKMCWVNGRCGYDWVCRQLKSVRQDYKVQAIRSADVVDVYETHARIALENSDLGEFNTCVAQVHDLYATLPASAASADEFTAYRIIYNVITEAKAWEQLRVVARLSPRERSRPATCFALDIRCAISTGNYHRYFHLVADPPGDTMIPFLLTRLDDRMRYRALCSMVAAYAPGQPALLPLRFVSHEIGCGPCKAVSHSNDNQNIFDTLSENENRDLKNILCETGLSHEPVWLLHCVSLLFRSNVILFVKRDSDVKSPIDAVYVDCKATKVAGGIRKPDSTRALITHAGSALRR